MVAIDPHSFWAGSYYNHPPLTDQMIVDAEAALGVPLPIELIQLLRIQNGGYTRGFAHPMKQRTSWAADHVPFDDLAGIVTDPNHETAQNLLQTAYMTAEWGLPAMQVLLSGGGPYWITLDYRKGLEPCIAWIDVDCGEDVQIAASFKSFLAGLVPAATYGT